MYEREIPTLLTIGIYYIPSYNLSISLNIISIGYRWLLKVSTTRR